MDNTLYRPLTLNERNSHLTANPLSIVASGEANYFDFAQINYVASGNDVGQVPTAQSIVSPGGLEFLQNDKLSNAKSSRDAAVSGIDIFNPYIHYISHGGVPFLIDFSTQFDEVAQKFNIYSKKYRQEFEDEEDS